MYDGDGDGSDDGYGDDGDDVYFIDYELKFKEWWFVYEYIFSNGIIWFSKFFGFIIL